MDSKAGPAISCSGLTRSFGGFRAVDDVSFQVARGQFFGFLGPNGAGKSTTIKMLTGLLEPTSGTAQILGRDFTADALELKRQIGVVPEGMALLGETYRAGVSTLRGADVWAGPGDDEPADRRVA